jgi:hypothetical protein
MANEMVKFVVEAMSEGADPYYVANNQTRVVLVELAHEIDLLWERLNMMAGQIDDLWEACPRTKTVNPILKPMG